MNKDQGRAFAVDWIESWNEHDLIRILDHYADDFEMNSPVIATRMGVEEGVLQGKAKVREYWAGALEAYPNLRFELKEVFFGVNSLIINYISSVSGAASEMFIFDHVGKVSKAYATYA